MPQESRLAYFKEAAGKPYRPSNGTDGSIFEAEFCNRCHRGNRSLMCSILSRVMLYDIGEKGYPKEWIYTEQGPTCTAFEEPKQRKPPRKKPAKGQRGLFE